MSFFKNKVYFVRHGETEWNADKRVQGSGDSPLTEKGISQAEQLAEKLKNHKFDLIVSSPLPRARKTAEIIAEKLDISEIKINSNIAERDFGVLEGKKDEESIKSYPEYWDKDGHFIDNSKVKDGELLDDFFQRVKKGLEELKNLAQTKNIIVVTHKNTLKAIASYIKNIPFNDVKKSYSFVHDKPFIFE